MRWPLTLVALMMALLLIAPTVVRAEVEVPPKVYIIRIPDIPGSWIDTDWARREIANDLVHLGFKVIHIETIDEFAELLENPPDNVIVVNCHGEILPTPYAWAVESKEKALEYIRRLATIVKEHGWTWVELAGGAFWYVGYVDGRKCDVGGDGIATFFSVIGAKADEWATATGLRKGCAAVISSHFKSWAKAHGFRIPDEIPERLWCGRALSTTLPVIDYLYRVDTNLGSPASMGPYPLLPVGIVKVGNGYYMHIGFHDAGWEDKYAKYGYTKPDGGSAEQSRKLGYLAAAMILYIRERYCPGYPIYIFRDPNEGASWVNRDAFFDALTSKLDALGLSYTVIDSNGLERLLMFSDVKNIIVVNCHGEWIPPGDWLKNHVDWDAGMKAYEWLHLIGEAMARRGWVWLNPAGYPFFDVKGLACVGDNGLAEVFAAAGGVGACHQVDCDFRDQMGVATPGGLKLLRAVRWLTCDCKPGMWCQRAISTDVKPIFALYEVRSPWINYPYGFPRYAGAIFKFGKGYYIHSGMGGGSHELCHMMSALIAYLHSPLFKELRKDIDEEWQPKYDELYAEYSAAAAKYRKLVEESLRVSDELEFLRHQTSYLLSQLDSLNRTYARVTSELQSAKSDLEKVKHEYSAALAKLSELESNVGELETKLAALKTEKSALESAIYAAAARRELAARATTETIEMCVLLFILSLAAGFLLGRVRR